MAVSCGRPSHSRELRQAARQPDRVSDAASPPGRSFGGRSYRGVLLIQRGDLSNGIRLLRAGFDERGAAGSVPRFFTFRMAEALGRVGQIPDGLAAIEEAIVSSERSEERWATAELLRIKGEL